MEKQTTISQPITLCGKGLHTGAFVHLTICPAGANTGFVFCRTDMAEQPMLKADARKVTFTQRGTVLAEGEATISTIEHLLSALRAERIDNCLIKLDGPEVPILDGSARPWVEAIEKAGKVEQDTERKYLVIDHKSVFEDKEKGIRILALPEADGFAAQVNIAFAGSHCLANQYALIESLDEYREVYDCRTFVFLHEVMFLLRAGLIKGGDLDNAIVFVDRQLTNDEMKELTQHFGKEQLTIHPSGVLNQNDLSYPNEAARHKLLDLIGDLALVGLPIKGRIIATCSGHGSNTAFARQLMGEYKL